MKATEDPADTTVSEMSKDGRVDPHGLFRFWTLLRQTYMMMFKSQERSLAVHGVNMSQYMALFLIRYSKGPVTPKSLATYLSQETASITYALDRLEERQLIERRPAQGDRREVWLSLTEQGRAFLAEAKAAAWEPLVRIATVLTDESELQELSASLLKLRNKGAEMIGANSDALDFAAEHLAPDPFMFRLVRVDSPEDEAGKIEPGGPK